MNIEEFKKEQKKAIDERVEMKIIEKATGDFLKNLIERDSNNIEVNYIALLGEYYNRTGFHYSHELEKIKGDTIFYFKKNDELSFRQDSNSPENLLIIGDNQSV